MNKRSSTLWLPLIGHGRTRALACGLVLAFAGVVGAQPPLPPPPTTTTPAPSQTPVPSQPLPAALLPAAPRVDRLIPPGSTPAPPPALTTDSSARIKDITFVEGDRINHLSGHGLVMGLNGTGARAEQTRLMATNYYLRQGVRIELITDTSNMSSVLVSGKVPAFARKGETILVTVSVADDASSLRGGTLVRTPLRGLDDEIYAIAQGPIVAGGIGAQGNAGAVQINHPNVGVCEAIVEREIDCGRIVQNGQIRLVLRNKSYSTATQITNVLNQYFPKAAKTLDSGTIAVTVPQSSQDDVPGFISMIGDFRVRPDQPAKVVVNQKTGTIVLGHNVKISRVLFASANIVISTNEAPVASQPAPLSGGDTAILPRTSIDIVESGGTYNVWKDGVTVGDLANALNSLAVSPVTLIDILTSLRNQGALQAELIIE
ncbi:MAG: flagellar basal body P-ring protein FlgI [Planctomycetota bacterium]